MTTKKLSKNSNNSLNVNKDKKDQDFIKMAATVTDKEDTTDKKVPIMIRFDADLLKRVESTAKKRGINRSAMIQFLVSRAIDEGNI